MHPSGSACALLDSPRPSVRVSDDYKMAKHSASIKFPFVGVESRKTLCQGHKGRHQELIVKSTASVACHGQLVHAIPTRCYLYLSNQRPAYRTNGR